MTVTPQIRIRKQGAVWRVQSPRYDYPFDTFENARAFTARQVDAFAARRRERIAFEERTRLVAAGIRASTDRLRALAAEHLERED